MDAATAPEHLDDHRRRWGVVVGWVAVVVVLVGVVAVLALLTFSVRVTGNSMAPTLRDGDRVLANVLNRGDVRRFDLVEATAPDSGTAIIKRVIGLPGDRVLVRAGDRAQEVLVVPAGQEQVHRVAGSSWTGTTGKPCCGSDGRSSAKDGWVVVPEGSYWVAGDNWTGSTDSRAFGFVADDQVGARLVLRVLPLGGFGEVPRPRLEPVTRAP